MILDYRLANRVTLRTGLGVGYGIDRAIAASEIELRMTAGTRGGSWVSLVMPTGGVLRSHGIRRAFVDEISAF